VDPTIPENPDQIADDVAADEAAAMAAESATPATPVPEGPKIKTLDQYLKEKRSSRASALFAVAEEDKSALESQFKTAPVSFRPTPSHDP